MMESSRSDRAVGVACLIGCPAISGLFLGLVAIVCAYPSGGSHTVVLGAVVAVVAFAANTIAICLTAFGIHRNAVRRTHDAARGARPGARVHGSASGNR